MSIVDFHTHILPGIDDGSNGIEQSLSMLRQEVEQGIGQIVATPHFYGDLDTPERFLRRRQEAADRLKDAICLHQWDLAPELYLGAEVYYFRGISEWDALEKLAIEGTSCILIEMPMATWTDQMYRELEQIYVRRGLTPIIAHVDRYIAPFRTHGIPRHLKDLPVYVQANASFFLQGKTRPMAMRMLKEGSIHLLGSDCHDDAVRKPNLGEALRRIEDRLGAEAIRQIRRNQARISAKFN